MIQTANRLQSVEEYYFSKKLKEVAQLVSEGNPVINLGIGSPDLKPAPAVIDALVQALSDPTAHKYQSYQGIPELRDAMATFYKTHYQVTLNPANEILPLLGSKEGIMHISMAFLNAGDQVLIPNPGYPTYESVTRLCEAEPLFYELDEQLGWCPDLQALEKQDLSRVKIMWISYPHMPTGALASREVLEKLANFAVKNKILVINDNPYSFILNNNPLSLLEFAFAKAYTLELNSLSKAFNLAGWRVGMVLGDAALIQSVLKVKSNMDSGMFYGIQKGAAAALKADQEWFKSLNIIYKERRDAVWKLADLLELEYKKDTCGLFVWAKVPTGIDAETLVNDLLYKHHIFITPGKVFGTQGNDYVRFSLCVPVETIEIAISRLQIKMTS